MSNRPEPEDRWTIGAWLFVLACVILIAMWPR